MLMLLDRQRICALSSQFSKVNYTCQAMHAGSFQLLFLNVLFLEDTYLKKKRKKQNYTQAKYTLPCKFKDVVDEAGSIFVAQHIRIYFQLFDQCFPVVVCVMDNVIASHVCIDLDPLHFFCEIDDTWYRPKNEREDRERKVLSDYSVSKLVWCYFYILKYYIIISYIINIIII